MSPDDLLTVETARTLIREELSTALQNQVDAIKKALTDEAWTGLPDRAGFTVEECSELIGFSPDYWRGLCRKRTALGEEHPAYAASLNNLAELLRSTGRYNPSSDRP